MRSQPQVEVSPDYKPQVPLREGVDPITIADSREGRSYTATYSDVGGELRLTELRVTAEEGATVTVHDLRAAPLSDLHAVASGAARLRAGALDDRMSSLPERFNSDEDYRRLWELYAALRRNGDKRALYTIAEATGIPHNTVASRIKTARKRGLNAGGN
jgi:hypothetical protein